MDRLIPALVILSVTPVLVFFMQLAANRLIKVFKIAVSNQVVVLASAAISHLPAGALIWFVYLQYLDSTTELIFAALYSIAVFDALTYAYFHLFNMSETARRIRILYEIYLSGVMTQAGLELSYNPSVMLENRLDRLVAMRQLRRKGNLYLLDNKLIYRVSSIVALWGGLLGIPYPELTNCAAVIQRDKLSRPVERHDTF